MIQESLSRLIKNKTVIIIAHRMRTVADADKIVVLKDGVVAESGTPEELKKKDGIYANMMKTQLMAADWSLLRICSSRKRSRRGKPLAFSISGSKRRGRTFPDHLSCAGIDGWFCVTDYRYSNWPQDGKKRNLCL